MMCEHVDTWETVKIVLEYDMRPCWNMKNCIDYTVMLQVNMLKQQKNV